MASLYYKYGTMSATKTRELLAIAYNYEIENGMKVFTILPSVANRDGLGVIASRDGGKRMANFIPSPEDDVLDNIVRNRPDIVLVDEAQFLSMAQVIQLGVVVDLYNIPVMCYGLKNDFKNDLFEGSKALLLYADNISEIKTICRFCTKKATQVLRYEDGKPVYSGEQAKPKADYVPVCRKHWRNPLELGEREWTTISERH